MFRVKLFVLQSHSNATSMIFFLIYPQTSSDSLLCASLIYSLGIQNMTFISVWASLVAPAVKNLPANAGDTRDTGSTPGLGRSPGGGHGNPLQYCCLENPHGQRSLAGYGP